MQRVHIPDVPLFVNHFFDTHRRVISVTGCVDNRRDPNYVSDIHSKPWCVVPA